MFGYITVHKEELKIKDYDKYHAYYCGVCRSLQHKYGFTGQLTLTYDMTFLAVLLSGLYEDETSMVNKHCVAHPFKAHHEIVNQYTDYAAAMNIMLSYYKLKDDWEDDKSLKANTAAALLKKAFKKADKEFPKQSKVIKAYIKNQHKCEQENEQEIDKVAACTGEMLAGIFVMKEDEYSENLREMGFYLGKFIYLLDAFDDIEKDIKHNNYNPLKSHFKKEDFNDFCRNILNTLAAYSARAFERLPIIENIDILRNIIYAGIWCKFNKIVISRTEKNKD